MKPPNFRNMSPEEFKAYRPRNEDEFDEKDRESDFRSWCKDNQEDPTDACARDSYEEMQEELGDNFWNRLDDDNRAGYEDNMNKD